MQRIISKILKEMHEFNQFRRRKIVKNYSKRMKEAQIKWPFYELKGECNQRFKIIRTLVKNKALKDKNDYFWAGAILLNSSRKSDYYLSRKLIKKYHELGGRRKTGCDEKYYKKQGWNKKEMEKYI